MYTLTPQIVQDVHRQRLAAAAEQRTVRHLLALRYATRPAGRAARQARRLQAQLEGPR